MNPTELDDYFYQLHERHFRRMIYKFEDTVAHAGNKNYSIAIQLLMGTCEGVIIGDAPFTLELSFIEYVRENTQLFNVPDDQVEDYIKGLLGVNFDNNDVSKLFEENKTEEKDILGLVENNKVLEAINLGIEKSTSKEDKNYFILLKSRFTELKEGQNKDTIYDKDYELSNKNKMSEISLVQSYVPTVFLEVGQEISSPIWGLL